MAVHLQKTILRNVAINTILCLVLSIGLSTLSGSFALLNGNLLWMCVLALGVGLFSGWQTGAGIKRKILRAITPDLAYQRLQRKQVEGMQELDWHKLDDFGAQLETRGFRHIGDFTHHPGSAQMQAVAACYVDASASTLIEVQYLQISDSTLSSGNPGLGGIHFSINSVLGGRIRITTTDHVFQASHFLLRGEYAVLASYPKLGLMPLLEKHEKLIKSVQQRSKKSLSTGLTIERYVLLQRELFAQATKRLRRMSGLEIARAVDLFEQDPPRKWAPSSTILAGLGARSLEELDHSEYSAVAAVIGEASTASGLISTNLGPHSQFMDSQLQAGAQIQVDAANPQTDSPLSGTEAAQLEDLQEKVYAGANWFYWIAALSIINLAMNLFGSKLGFVLGLGFSQVISAITAANDAPITGMDWILHGVNFMGCLFFAACGWFARRPSLIAFGTGLLMFALDSIIFVVAQDWIAVAFHALALFLIWRGMQAARQIKNFA